MKDTVELKGLHVTRQQLEDALLEFDKPTYPICMKSKRSGMIVLFTNKTTGRVLYPKNKNNNYSRVGKIYDDFTDISDKSAWEEIPYDKKRGFYDGQMVWCWGDDDIYSAGISMYVVEKETTRYNDTGLYVERKNYSSEMPKHIKDLL